MLQLIEILKSHLIKALVEISLIKNDQKISGNEWL